MHSIHTKRVSCKVFKMKELQLTSVARKTMQDQGVLCSGRFVKRCERLESGFDFETPGFEKGFRDVL